jgi:uncharacterized membrane protein
LIAKDNEGASFMAEDVAPSRKARIAVRRLQFDDLAQSLRQGLLDFARAPLYGLFFGGVYAVGGWLIVALVFWLDWPYLAYPLALGFALVAPFVCAGLYEVSRTFERGGAPTWPGVLGAVWARAGTELGWLALVSLFTLILWVDFAWTFFLLFHGLHVPGLRELIAESFTTFSGFLYLVAGNVVGALIAFLVFSITVVTPTLLVDRDIDAVTAITTSVRLVIANPRVMAGWAATIGALMALSIATGFLGLFVVLPVLGHASWALYRRAIV